MKKDVVLVPSQSKRLIAKAIFQTDFVENAYKNGRIIITRGTTNSYIVEEFMGKPFEKTRFTSGVTMPGGKFWIENEKFNEFVIDHGVISEKPFSEMADSFSEKDIIFKGANAVNYAKGTAGIFIKNREGGTSGEIFRAVYGKRAKLVIPVGLEKETSFDLDEMALLMNGEKCDPEMPRLFSFKARLFTEIEAVEVLAQNKVSAYHIGTGGVLGAEGSVRLLLDGDEKCLSELLRLVSKLPYEDEFSA